MLVGRTVQLELLCTVGYLLHPSAGCDKTYLLGTTSSKSRILKSREGRRNKNLQKWKPNDLEDEKGLQRMEAA
jgi:hypothetical protein